MARLHKKLSLPEPIPLLGLIVFVVVAPAWAQRPSDIIQWSAAAPAGATKAGGTVTVQVTASLEPGWHLYALTQPENGPKPLEFKAGEGFTVVKSRIEAPPPQIASDESFGIETQYYDAKTTFAVPIAIATSVAAGRHSVPLDVAFQACNARVCLRPFNESLKVDVTVAAAGSSRKKEKK